MIPMTWLLSLVQPMHRIDPRHESQYILPFQHLKTLQFGLVSRFQCRLDRHRQALRTHRLWEHPYCCSEDDGKHRIWKGSRNKIRLVFVLRHPLVFVLRHPLVMSEGATLKHNILNKTYCNNSLVFIGHRELIYWIKHTFYNMISFFSQRVKMKWSEELNNALTLDVHIWIMLWHWTYTYNITEFIKHIAYVFLRIDGMLILKNLHKVSITCKKY